MGDPLSLERKDRAALGPSVCGDGGLPYIVSDGGMMNNP